MKLPPKRGAGEPFQGPLFVVLNARSGSDDATDVQQVIETTLREAGRRFELLRVDAPQQLQQHTQRAVQLARQHQGAVVAAGGDGTLNTVAAAALHAGCPFGVVPQGTFNYFSRAHGIPLQTAEATQALLSARLCPTQVGRVNGEVFLVNASVGLYPRLLEDREAYKREYGRNRLVAMWAALVTLSTAHRPLRLQLHTGAQARTVRTPTLFVGNNALQLEQTGIAGSAALRQGALVGTLVGIVLQPVGTLAMLALLLRGALGQLGQAREVSSFTFERLTAQPAAPRGHARVKVATDGEVRWLRAPLVFDVAPEPLQLLKPDTPS